MKKDFPSLVLKNMREKKAESGIKDDAIQIKQTAREMQKKPNEPDGEHNTNFDLEEPMLHHFSCCNRSKFSVMLLQP